MYQVVKESELCVHFHNNHFATLYKHQNSLYSLVTDIELLRQAPQVVWMRLADVQGDDLFLDQHFQIPRKDGSSRRNSQSAPSGGGSPPMALPVHGHGQGGDYEPPRGGGYGYTGQLPGTGGGYEAASEYPASRGGRKRRDSYDDREEECIIL